MNSKLLIILTPPLPVQGPGKVLSQVTGTHLIYKMSSLLHVWQHGTEVELPSLWRGNTPTDIAVVFRVDKGLWDVHMY
ncbi:hypothetical protein LX32DRAFT_348262 [Colletotrichum zoysiae]|uniref:Uncharacterized protein n=1 Tax=Colletotrichum zoysiae TaxID=1216348 RepID=A0AAD9M5M7_9PEZI|nr:hypothetical protein LX32DRAFT_348262 [Colletotrichum zoysiae]